MFVASGAESLCVRNDVGNGYALTAGVGANLATSAKTITGRETPFPMVDPYSPVARARVPVPGYTVWPRRANRLGRRFYGLSGGDALTLSVAQQLKGPKKGFAGLGAFEPGWDSELGLPPIMPPIGSGSSGGIDWGRIIGQAIGAAPAIIQTARGGTTPTGYYNNTGQLVPLSAADRERIALQAGYQYNSSGELVKGAANNITDFISDNPLLVGGGILAVVLLMMRPPGRR